MLLLACLAVPYSARTTWEAHPVAGVTLYTPVGQQRLAGTLKKMITASMPRLTKVIGVPVPDRFAIYAYTSQRAFHLDTQAEPFTRGLSYSPGGEIRFYAADDPGAVRRTLAHELAHSLVSQRLGEAYPRLPTWVNEGIAGHLSEPVSRTALLKVSHLIHRDGVLVLEELDAAFPEGPYRDAAYLQSRSMVAWLVHHHPDAIDTVLRRMAAGDTFAEALLSATGLTPLDWLREWVRSVPEYLFWLNILGSPILFAPLAILMVIIVLLRLKQRREAEEAEEAQAAVEAPAVATPSENDEWDERWPD